MTLALDIFLILTNSEVNCNLMDVETRPSQDMLRNLKLDEPQKHAFNTASTQELSEAALFSRVLQENRLPKPKMMTFDGDPKRYKLFMASFRNNVEARLDGDDQLKLTLLLDQCTGEAFELIEECVMLKPEQGYRTAIEKAGASIREKSP